MSEFVSRVRKRRRRVVLCSVINLTRRFGSSPMWPTACSCAFSFGVSVRNCLSDALLRSLSFAGSAACDECGEGGR